MRAMLIVILLGSIQVINFAGITSGWVEQQISNGGYIDIDAWPQISQGNIAWGEQRDGDYQIFFWDGNTVRQISQGPGDCGYPQISGANVTWRQDIGGTTQIMFFNGTTTIQLTSGSNQRNSPRISGSRVVWVEAINNIYTIMLWNGSSPQAISQWDCDQPSLWDDHIVWVQSKKVMLWNGSNSSEIAQTEDSIQGLRLCEGKAIWLETTCPECPFPPGKVMYWNSSSVSQLSATSNCTQPQISDGKAAWIENEQVMYWDGSTVIALTANSKEKKNLAISGSRVIWNERPSLVPVSLLYLWDGTTSIRFTDASGCGTPAIWQDKIVWIAYNADYDFQVFLAQPGTIPVPIPGDINGDQTVDISDFSIFSQNWLK